MELDTLHSRVAAIAGTSVKTLDLSVCLSVPVRRIVTFHPSGLTDLLWSLPALAALRDSFPGAVITAVARPPQTSLLRATTCIDEVLARPRGGLSSQAALMARLHSGHFEMAIAFSPSRNTTLLAWSTGAAVRAGYVGAKMDTLLTHRIAPDQGHLARESARDTAPDLESYLALVREVGCATHHHDATDLIDPGADANRRAQRLLDGAGISGQWLLIAPQAGRKKTRREWSHDGWNELIGAFKNRYPIVLVGTTPRPELASEGVFDFGGRTDLPTLAALCARARLACGIDCGALHMAAALKTPIVALMNDDDTRRRPRGAICRIVELGEGDEAARALTAVRELIGV